MQKATGAGIATELETGIELEKQIQREREGDGARDSQDNSVRDKVEQTQISRDKAADDI